MHSPDTTEYDERDPALYALGIGAANDPADNRDLQLVHERHSSGFRAFPTFAVIPAMNSMMKRAMDGLLHRDSITGWNGCSTVSNTPKSLSRSLRRPSSPTRHASRRSGTRERCLVNIETESFDENGVSLIKNEFISFIQAQVVGAATEGPARR